MLRKALLIAASVLAFAAPAQAEVGRLAPVPGPPGVTFTLIAPSWPTPVLHGLERALLYQLNVQLRHAWHTPTAGFGPGGVPVHFVSQAVVRYYCGPDRGGCHYPGQIWISALGWRTTALSHELVEYMVDPGIDRLAANGMLIEVCDPVAGLIDPDQRVVDWNLSDFVTPAWYQLGAHGPFDLQRAVTAPFEVLTSPL